MSAVDDPRFGSRSRDVRLATLILLGLVFVLAGFAGPEVNETNDDPAGVGGKDFIQY